MCCLKYIYPVLESSASIFRNQVIAYTCIWGKNYSSYIILGQETPLQNDKRKNISISEEYLKFLIIRYIYIHGTHLNLFIKILLISSQLCSSTKWPTRAAASSTELRNFFQYLYALSLLKLHLQQEDYLLGPKKIRLFNK